MSLELQASKLEKLKSAILDKQAVNKVMSRGLEQLIKKNFSVVSATEKNKFGKGSSFWRRMIEGTKGGSDARVAYVDMPRPVAQRYFGGKIIPTGTKRYLTIPISKKSYGRSARFFDDLEIYTSHLGNKFLVLKKKVRKKTVYEFLYLLKERVFTKPNKRVLPSREEIVANMAESFAAYLKSRTR
jgi:hypothetical protein